MGRPRAHRFIDRIADRCQDYPASLRARLLVFGSSVQRRRHSKHFSFVLDRLRDLESSADSSAAPATYSHSSGTSDGICFSPRMETSSPLIIFRNTRTWLLNVERSQLEAVKLPFHNQKMPHRRSVSHHPKLTGRLCLDTCYGSGFLLYLL